jgi:hypothetical protein
LNKIASIFRSTRTWGLIGTAAVLYFLVFVLFGKTDVSSIMPDTRQMARNLLDVWPHMPFFEVQKQPVASGNGTYIYYTVPTRQFTPQELQRMGSTNVVAQPAKPK